MNTKSTSEEDELIDAQPPRDVVAFNELRSCADLFRLFSEGTLEIQPYFQRNAVWKTPDQSKFIDSLIKQLPIPSMCFSLDSPTQKWQVVDGLQRMTAIISFLGNKEWRLSRLKEIDQKISGRTNFDIRDGDEDSKILYRRIQNLSLPITVIRCDQSRKDHSEYLFTIFHRLNSGGSKLNNQEIRNCIYSGVFNERLRDWDENPKWKIIKNIIPGKGARFKSIELILRFLALRISMNEYSGNMPSFLNNFMRENRNPSNAVLVEWESAFNKAVNELLRAIDTLKLTSIGYTLLEAALLGISENIQKVPSFNNIALGKMLQTLADTYAISGAESKSDTTATAKVKERVREAQKIFS